MYHCNEEVAFWIFVQLMHKNYQIRSIYTPPDTPGITYHVNIIEKLIKIKHSKLNDYMEEQLYLATH